jgi:hypothetical protein
MLGDFPEEEINNNKSPFDPRLFNCLEKICSKLNKNKESLVCYFFYDWLP